MKFYRTIEEMPIWTPPHTNEPGDVRYMLKLDDYFDMPDKNVDYDSLVDHFIMVSDELFERFGVDDRAITNMIEEKDIIMILV